MFDFVKKKVVALLVRSSSKMRFIFPIVLIFGIVISSGTTNYLLVRLKETIENTAEKGMCISFLNMQLLS